MRSIPPNRGIGYRRTLSVVRLHGTGSMQTGICTLVTAEVRICLSDRTLVPVWPFASSGL